MVHYGSQVNTVVDADGPCGGSGLLSQCLSVEFQQTGLEVMFSCGEVMRKCPEDDVAKSGTRRVLL
jgi:hypothetical protein